MLKYSKTQQHSQMTQNHSTSPYFDTQITRSVVEFKSSRRLSPFLKENRDSVNLKTAGEKLKASPSCIQGKSLREKINDQLRLEGSKRRTPSILAHPKTQYYDPPVDNECLSSLRKMLTESSPDRQPKEKTARELEVAQVFRRNREEFELRQRHMLAQKQQRQKQALAERLQRQSIECTFKPRLTVYKRR